MFIRDAVRMPSIRDMWEDFIFCTRQATIKIINTNIGARERNGIDEEKNPENKHDSSVMLD